MEWLLNFLRPPEDASPKSIRRWNFNVSITMLILGGFCIFSVSPYGFAWAGDMRQVDQKIEKAVAPTNQKLDSLAKLVTDSLATGKAAAIRSVISKRCKTQGFMERDELAREKDRLQEEYRTLKGEFYREPECSQL